MTIREMAELQREYIINARHRLHQHPELSCQERETTAFIVDQLREMGLEVRTFEDIHGCVADITGDVPGRTVLLRADIDALPIQEDTGLDFASVNPGVMHACGHDCHTAMLLGAARILTQLRKELRGRVRLLFQMGEEIGREAEKYVDRGVLEGVDAAMAIHVSTKMPSGTASFEQGARMASNDRFVIDIQGMQAHGSAPHLGHDAILAASAVVMALQSIASRQTDPLDSFVLTVGVMKGGIKQNILAGDTRLEGTVRTFNSQLRESVPQRIKEVAENVARGYGCQAQCQYFFGPGALINADSELVTTGREAVTKVLGEKGLGHLRRSMGSEDFSVIMEHVPGVYGYLGCTAENQEFCSHHNPHFLVDESVLPSGAGLYAQFAMEYLNGANAV